MMPKQPLSSLLVKLKSDRPTEKLLDFLEFKNHSTALIFFEVMNKQLEFIMKKLFQTSLWTVLAFTMCSEAAFAAGISEITVTDSKIFACPRCRRAAPKGPRKRPHPKIVKKENPSQPTTVEK